MKKEIRRKVYDKYDGHCSYCGKEIAYKDMQVDHKNPKALNRPIGRDIDGNYVYPDIDALENLMPSCRRCNHYKRAEPLNHFRNMIKTIQDRLMKIYIFKVAVDYGIIKIEPFDGVFYFEKQNNDE